MDTRLALTGTPVNVLASIGAGQDLAARQAQMGRTAQEWGLYRQHGEGIASGDQNAINALARFDPTAALGVRQTHQSMSHAEERMGLARAAAARAAQSHAASLSAAERAEEGQRLGRAVATLIGPLRAGDLETVNQGLRTLGITDGPIGSLDDAAILMAGVETALPYFEAGQAMLGGGGEADYRFSDGQFWDANNPEAGAQPIPGFTPGAPETVINNNLPGQDEFDVALARQQANMFNDVFTQGRAATSTLGQIDRLEGLLSNIGSGAEGAFLSLAGNLGIDLGEGTSNVQAAEAIINRMVPQQRPPGSGPMSDADLALFQRSLPRLINSPDGNRLIIETMRGISQYEAQAGAIASQVMAGTMTRQQGLEALQSLPNPLAGFEARAGQIEAAPPASRARPEGMTDAEWMFLNP